MQRYATNQNIDNKEKINTDKEISTWKKKSKKTITVKFQKKNVTRIVY